MKYRLLGSAVVMGFVSLSCQTRVDRIATPVPTEAHAKVSGKSFQSLKRGHGVYMKQCAQCHEHRLPNTTTLPDWHSTIGAMSDLAGLPKADEQDLQHYLGEFSDR